MMLRAMILRAVLIVSLPALAFSEMLPEALGEFERKSLEPVEPDQRELQEEFGFEEAEKAVYVTSGGKRTEITATRYYDDTGAFSAFFWLKSSEGAYSEYGKRAWVGPDGVLIQFGNYLVEMNGAVPEDEHVELMLAYLPRVRITVDPPVLKFVPAGAAREESERHILGPVALESLAPEVPPSTVGFHFGAEAHYGRYPSAEGEMRMLLFGYPSPQMARAQIEQFHALEGVVAKRDGPLIAAVIAPPSPDEAERLLSRIRYAAEVTTDYVEPGRHDNVGTLLLDIMILCGILAVLCVAGGILVAGARILAGRVAPSSIFAAPESDGMIHLDIDRR